ncbi:Hypothetical protein, putative, partial [Bodo saltans]
KGFQARRALQGTPYHSCYIDYDASTISTDAECSIGAPATDGCGWCNNIHVCLLVGSSSPNTCLEASTGPTTGAQSIKCQWCASSSSIGVCQPRTGTCWAACPPATNDPLSRALCIASLSGMWCPAEAGGLGGTERLSATGVACTTLRTVGRAARYAA